MLCCCCISDKLHVLLTQVLLLAPTGSSSRPPPQEQPVPSPELHQLQCSCTACKNAQDLAHSKWQLHFEVQLLHMNSTKHEQTHEQTKYVAENQEP